MSNLQPVRGTHDLLAEDARRHRYVEDTALAVAKRYGYSEIMTPIFEFTEVFARTLGETSDVVSKEMYTFADRGGDSITLRPEGTAGVARAFISGGMAQSLPLKLFYRGPMFRYERPQKGRLRQFHQIGAELLGVDNPLGDAEIIAMAWRILCKLGLRDKVTLQLNTLGDAESRTAYRHALVSYLDPLRLSLSEESRARLDRNPLRVLDSKDEGDQRVVANAPQMTEILTPQSAEFFQQVQEGLTALDVPFVINPKLVRGLDYYCHTAFEFVTDALGAQGTVLAGGRYDNLISNMGGPATAGIGWAAGIERLSMLVEDMPPLPRLVSVIPMGDMGKAMEVAERLRGAGLLVELDFSGNMKKRMARAVKNNAHFAVILGEEEMARQAVTLRDLDRGEQEEISLNALVNRLSAP